MSGFQFPPPPPPPPKASNGDAGPPGQSGQPTGRGRGRGRGRGGSDSRGRGGRGRGNSFQHRGQHQGSNGHSSHAGGSSYSNPNLRQNVSSGAAPSNSSASNPLAGLPPGSYVNPAFHQDFSSYGSATTSSISADHSSHFGQTAPNGSSTKNVQQSPPRTAAGHKRKLDALRGPTPEKKQPGPPTGPSIPSFGNPIIPVHNGPTAALAPPVQTKRGSNMLGLTPQDNQPQYSSDSDEDDDGVDEEAMYAELGSNLTFEHNGTVMTLNTAADLAAWKEERLKNFPTKQRLIVKMEEKRKIGEERKRLLTEASEALRVAKEAKIRPKSTGQSEVERRPSQPETELEKAKRELAMQSARLEQLRKQVAKSEAKAARAREQENANEQVFTMDATHAMQQPEDSTSTLPGAEKPTQNGVELAASSFAGSSGEQPNGNQGTDEPAVPGESTELKDQESAASPAASSGSRADGTDDDGPPEEVSSTRMKGNKKIRKVCEYFATRGTCKAGDMCTDRHDRKPRSALQFSQVRQQRYQPRHVGAAEEQDEDQPSSTRITIFDRLVEQEQGQEDKLALQVIMHLGKVGLFSKEVDSTS